VALTDDLNKLAAQDVVYLTRTTSLSFPGFPAGTLAAGTTEVSRGRLRQALNGDWVFNASTGQNGVVGFVLGKAAEDQTSWPSWSSSESPATGVQITIIRTWPIAQMQPGGQPSLGAMSETIVLTNVIPTDFAD